MTISFERSIRDILTPSDSEQNHVERGIVSICGFYLAKYDSIQKYFYRESIIAARNIMDYVAELQIYRDRARISDELAAYLLFAKIFQQGAVDQGNFGIRVFSTDFGSRPSRLWMELADVMFREFSNFGNNILFYTYGRFCQIDDDPYHEYSAVSQHLALGEEEDEDQVVIAEQKIRYNHMNHMIQHYINQRLPIPEAITIINPNGSCSLAVEEVMPQCVKEMTLAPSRVR